MVKVEEFTQTLLNEMKHYTNEVREAINEEVELLGEEGAKKLKNTIYPEATESGTANPSIRRDWNKYVKGWVCDFEENATYSKSIVRNKNMPQLIHLLEYGHDTKDGNRTRAFAHVQPLSNELEKRLLENAEKIIKKGGKL